MGEFDWDLEFIGVAGLILSEVYFLDEAIRVHLSPFKDTHDLLALYSHVEGINSIASVFGELTHLLSLQNNIDFVLNFPCDSLNDARTFPFLL